MKRIFSFWLILVIVLALLSSAFGELQPDNGYNLIITLVSDNLGTPSEFIDDSDWFTVHDEAKFNTKSCSNFVILDFQDKSILVGGRLTGN